MHTKKKPSLFFVNGKLRREVLNIEWFASWNIEPKTIDIYKCNNHIDGIIMWQNVTATKDNLNRCIIANTRYNILSGIWMD